MGTAHILVRVPPMCLLTVVSYSISDSDVDGNRYLQTICSCWAKWQILSACLLLVFIMLLSDMHLVQFKVRPCLLNARVEVQYIKTFMGVESFGGVDYVHGNDKWATRGCILSLEYALFCGQAVHGIFIYHTLCYDSYIFMRSLCKTCCFVQP